MASPNITTSIHGDITRTEQLTITDGMREVVNNYAGREVIPEELVGGNARAFSTKDGDVFVDLDPAKLPILDYNCSRGARYQLDRDGTITSICMVKDCYGGLAQAVEVYPQICGELEYRQDIERGEIDPIKAEVIIAALFGIPQFATGFSLSPTEAVEAENLRQEIKYAEDKAVR